MKIFRRILAADVRRDQLIEAERLAVEHRASAEHHQALASMYAQRAERLTREQGAAERPDIMNNLLGPAGRPAVTTSPPEGLAGLEFLRVGTGGACAGAPSFPDAARRAGAV